MFKEDGLKDKCIKGATLVVVAGGLIAGGLVNATESTCVDDSYYRKNFAKAKDPEKFNLEWAACEEKLGNIDEAISAYERVLIYNGNNREARRGLGRLYADKDKRGDNSRLTPRQRQSISSVSGESGEMVTTRYSAELKFGYDDNINHSIVTRNLPFATIARKTKGSAFHSLDLKAGYVNELEEPGGFNFQANADIYWQENYSAHYFDTLAGSFDMGPGYSWGNLSIYVPLVYNRIHYLDTDLYHEYGIAPNITYALRSDLLLNGGIKYLKHNYLESLNKGGNSSILGGYAGIYKFFGEDYIYTRVAYTRSHADKAVPLPLTDYFYWQFFVGGSYELNWGVIARLDYQHGYGEYKDIPAGATYPKRKDNFNQIHLSFEKYIASNMKIVAEYTYSDSDCNFPMQAYEKSVVSVGFKYTY